MIKRAAALAAFIGLVSVFIPIVGPDAPGSASPLVFGRFDDSFQPTDGKVFVLVIGNDARSGNPDRSLADAIHIVGVNTKTLRGGILNFPRDSWVNVPGYGSAKINEALFRGGPELVGKTLQDLTGIELDYWVMTGFEGFQGLIKDLGGVKIHIPQDVYDPGGSGAHIKAGTQNIGAATALAYTRTRKSLKGGDVDRTTNQGRFLVAMLNKLHRQTSNDPAAVLDWMVATRRNVRLNVTADEQFRLGILVSQLSPRDIGNVTVPVSLGFVGAASVVFIAPGARALFDRFAQNASL